MAQFGEGMHDPLTGLLTPAHFYESTERLLSWAERSHQPVSLISVKLEPVHDDELARCARQISSELRGGDLLSRMGIYTFALLLLGDDVGAKQLIFRLSNTVKSSIAYESTSIEIGEGIEAGLARLAI